MKAIPRIDLVTVIFLGCFLLFTGLWWGRFATISCEMPTQNQNPRSAAQYEAHRVQFPGFPQEHSQQSREEASEGEICLSYTSITHWLYDSKFTDWIVALFTIVLAWKTWGLHVATRGLQEAAVDQAKMTYQLFSLDQRPWIDLKISAPGWGRQGDTVTASIIAEAVNIGKSPAFNVTMACSERYETNVPALKITETKKIAESMRALGTTLFPNNSDQVKFDMKFSRPIDETEKVFVAFVCAIYTNMVDNSEHETSFHFVIGIEANDRVYIRKLGGANATIT